MYTYIYVWSGVSVYEIDTKRQYHYIGFLFWLQMACGILFRPKRQCTWLVKSYLTRSNRRLHLTIWSWWWVLFSLSQIMMKYVPLYNSVHYVWQSIVVCADSDFRCTSKSCIKKSSRTSKYDLWWTSRTSGGKEQKKQTRRYHRGNTNVIGSRESVRFKIFLMKPFWEMLFSVLSL